MARRRSLRSMTSILLRISSLLMRNPSPGCFRQSSPMSSFSITFSSTETAGKNLLDAMDLCGHVSRGNAGDLGDASCIRIFEIEEDDLPLDRIQLLDESAQPLQRLLMIERLGIVSNRQIVDVIETHQRTLAGTLMPHHVRRRHVVRDAIHPR